MSDDPHGSSLDATRKRLGELVDFVAVEYAYPPGGRFAAVTFLIATTEGEVVEPWPEARIHVFTSEAAALEWVQEKPDVRAYRGAQRRLW